MPSFEAPHIPATFTDTNNTPIPHGGITRDFDMRAACCPSHFLDDVASVPLRHLSRLYKLVFPKLFFARGPLLASQNNHASSHPSSRKHCVRYQKLNIYISEMILDSYGCMPVAQITMNCIIWASLKWLLRPSWVLFFFLIVYSNGYTK
jgi:hypothetical protein